MTTTEVQVRKRRLRRSDCAGPGLRRVRRGRGFYYVDHEGAPLEDPEILERVRAMAIPPAWKEVWICPDPMGHLQATAVDAAGRKQYLYHARWREHRDRAKFTKMLDFGRGLPRLRRRVVSELEGAEPTRERVLTCAVRLLDVGVFRIGSEEYADDDGGLGLATLHREHVTVHPDAVGNTPAVSRRSYIDPRVFGRYQSGWTIAGVLSRIPDPGGIDDRIRARIERGVLDLLEDDRESPALEKIEKRAA